MEICKTDVSIIMRYLGDAAVLYDGMSGNTAYNRARLIRNLVRKLNKKLKNI